MIASIAAKDRPHIDFARRLEQAANDNPKVPEPHHGRLKWFVDEFKSRFNENTTQESVRRWLHGSARPRPGKLSMLAQILQVDEAWLSVGTEGELKYRRRAAQSASAPGAVNVVTGLIQLAGGNPAFPSSEDPRAKEEGVNLYAIIKGAQYAFRVEPAYIVSDKIVFNVPAQCENLVNLGVVVEEDMKVTVYELPWEVVTERGRLRSGHFELTLDGNEDTLRRITDFSSRF